MFDGKSIFCEESEKISSDKYVIGEYSIEFESSEAFKKDE